MWCLSLLLMIIISSKCSAKSLQIKENENNEISLYVKLLINDFNMKYPAAKDVGIFTLSKIDHREVNDLAEDIRKSFPDTVAVNSPSLVYADNLYPHTYSFIIIVSDVTQNVSFPKFSDKH